MRRGCFRVFRIKRMICDTPEIVKHCSFFTVSTCELVSRREKKHCTSSLGKVSIGQIIECSGGFEIYSLSSFNVCSCPLGFVIPKTEWIFLMFGISEIQMNIILMC